MLRTGARERVCTSETTDCLSRMQWKLSALTLPWNGIVQHMCGLIAPCRQIALSRFTPSRCTLLRSFSFSASVTARSSRRMEITSFLREGGISLSFFFPVRRSSAYWRIVVIVSSLSLPLIRSRSPACFLAQDGRGPAELRSIRPAV